MPPPSSLLSTTLYPVPLTLALSGKLAAALCLVSSARPKGTRIPEAGDRQLRRQRSAVCAAPGSPTRSSPAAGRPPLPARAGSRPLRPRPFSPSSLHAAHPGASCNSARYRPCRSAAHSPGRRGSPCGCSSSAGRAAAAAPGSSAAASGSARSTELRAEGRLSAAGVDLAPPPRSLRGKQKGARACAPAPGPRPRSPAAPRQGGRPEPAGGRRAPGGELSSAAARPLPAGASGSRLAERARPSA